MPTYQGKIIRDLKKKRSTGAHAIQKEQGGPDEFVLHGDFAYIEIGNMHLYVEINKANEADFVHVQLLKGKTQLAAFFFMPEEERLTYGF